jgi:hypothetical protein
MPKVGSFETERAKVKASVKSGVPAMEAFRSSCVKCPFCSARIMARIPLSIALSSYQDCGNLDRKQQEKSERRDCHIPNPRSFEFAFGFLCLREVHFGFRKLHIGLRQKG